jgi:hypothetical protein
MVIEIEKLPLNRLTIKTNVDWVKDVKNYVFNGRVLAEENQTRGI